MGSISEDLRALSHPKRVAMVEELARGGLGFSELMRRIGIEDSSLMLFHVNKLKGIVERQNGTYSLTKKGRVLHGHLARLNLDFAFGWNESCGASVRVTPGGRTVGPLGDK